MKRVLDIMISLVALVALAPLLMLVMIILRLTGEGDVFYIQKRIGYKMKPFGLIKFVTMARGSEKMASGDITRKDDPRVLPFGKILRKTKINELPQIINVLKGDMSIIGPRPLTLKHFNYYADEVKEVIAQMHPGLSGAGSIFFRNEETLMADLDMSCHDFYKQHIAPYKGELEIWYQHNRYLWVDMMLVFLTAWVIVFPKTNLIFRLFQSIPQGPVFLMDKRDRKGSKSSVRVIEDAPRIVEIGPTARKAGQSKVSHER
ncbi:MAG: lipid carrier--UDP-N-acetylgalactosaminyltransferase [Planctomycetes bacterium B3_Pla]|nr:MAG: lipid carrier--UDP-N-acetylgalactosaminyltransferase [Planctomycetes bacterium B3_Pla]